ncbi:hypothetical protein GBF38_020955 [Nibea albiflora]|uniref:Uncharacterized protein n=1 Tax=Nibea albiflora TaxID=240163 RepID=A0ACB7FFZ8_NIBAL|nr:hypothetical protein GBF38_020955 [Nibea albiflora]
MSVSGMKKQLHKASQVTVTNRAEPGQTGLVIYGIYRGGVNVSVCAPVFYCDTRPAGRPGPIIRPEPDPNQTRTRPRSDHQVFDLIT